MCWWTNRPARPSRIRGKPRGSEKTLTRTIHKVGHDIERLAFNTAIAAVIGLVNEAMSAAERKARSAFTVEQIERFCIMLSPLAPHMSEEVWSRLGLTDVRGCCSDQHWPSIDEKLLIDDSVEIPVQIQGKIKARIRVPTGADQKTTESIALTHPDVIKAIDGRPVKKAIVVPGKLVNLVV